LRDCTDKNRFESRSKEKRLLFFLAFFLNTMTLEASFDVNFSGWVEAEKAYKTRRGANGNINSFFLTVHYYS
jgi:hypothetical protein